MGYLLTSAIVSLIFGLLLLASPGLMGGLGAICNSVLFILNGWLMRFRIWVGLALLVLGGWIMYVGVRYPDNYITAAWIIIVAFGLLFIFLPNWLTWLSKVSNAVLLSTDELVMGSRRVIGVVLLIISLYILYATFLIQSYPR